MHDVAAWGANFGISSSQETRRCSSCSTGVPLPVTAALQLPSSFQAAPILFPSITAVIDGGGVCSSEAPCRSEYCQNVHSYVCLSCASTASLLARAASPYLGLMILHT